MSGELFEKALRAISEGVEFREPHERITGRVNSTASPQTGAPSGYFWVYEPEGRAEELVIIGDRMMRYNNTAGKRCQVGYNTGGEKVAFAPVNDSTTAANTNAAQQAESLNTVVYAQNVTGSRILASSQENYLGVYIERDDKIGWAGGDLPIDPGDLPSGTDERGWLVWYYPDGQTTPTYVATTPVVRPNKANQLLSEARDLVLPAGARRIGANTVYTGQTTVTYDNTRFEDLRDWLTPTGLVIVDTSGANDGDVPVWDTATGTWEPTAPATGGVGDYILIRDQKTANTAGGSFTSGAWRTRDLTTEVVDTGNHASLSSNQITLAAGTYRARITCPAQGVVRHQAKLYNVTDTADVLIGTSSYANADDPNVSAFSRSEIVGRFTLASQKVLEVQHQCSATKNTFGFGIASNFGVVEVYTVVELIRE